MINGKKQFDDSFILAPVPVVLVASRHEELGDNLITIAWCGVGCSDPQIINISIRPGRYSHRMIKESGSFTVNIPDYSLLDEVKICGAVSGRDCNKFERAGLTPLQSEKIGAPLVAECPLNIECVLLEVKPLGVHDLFIGKVVRKHADSGILTDGGKIDMDGVELISYVNGKYRVV
ncbi:MAG TPA: flavin reductase family protein [Candidatus Krumholzibacteriaceae bacterium]|nr:flavin reductase family protein [Candidatus Krumholzibacteriaceae bacterium]